MKTKVALVLSHLLACLVLSGIGVPASAKTAAVGPDVFGSRPQGVDPHLLELLDHRTAPLRNDGSSGLQRRRLAGEKAPSSLNAVLLMCDFSDSLILGRYGQVPGDFPAPMQTEIYYGAHDSVYFDHLLQDVADYYQDVSGGAFTLNYTIHPRVVNLPEPMSFYGNHPTEGEQPLLMAAGVVDSLDSEIDFSLYDTVIMVHAGAGEETDILGDSPEQIYSTYLDPRDFQTAFEDSLLAQPYLATGDHPEGEGLDHVLVLPETEYQDLIQGFGGYFGSLGVYCFEVGLRLGMLSLSDFTPAGRPDSQGIGEFGLMGYGLFVGMGWIPPHPCAYNKVLMGWLDPLAVNPDVSGTHFLTPCEDTAAPEAAIRVDITGQEYWLLAYRQQDPDGNRIFSHPGDLNGNNIPDFFDADSQFGDGTPTGYFDPATDTRERLVGCEWDFFMSENSARGPYDKGAGSGVYIWHIDEGVVSWAFDQPSNFFNADPLRKSVDLEEGDGIQDLDSKIPSAYQLGGDDDSFRGEDSSEFGPVTSPATLTNGGARTGVRFSGFSNVVRDSSAFIASINFQVDPPDTVMGFVYADTVAFQLERLPADQGPQLAARRDLPAGLDLRGSHLVTADLDGDGNDEIIAAGTGGQVYVLTGDLNEFLDHDGDPDTLEPFALGARGGEPVAWNLPPAVGNIDQDPEPEIVLTGPDGIYAFDGNGASVRVQGTGDSGFYLELPGCKLPPVLVPVQPDSLYSPEEPALIAAVNGYGDYGTSTLTLYRGDGENDGMVLTFELGSNDVPAPPVFGWGALGVAVLDTVNGNAALRFFSADPVHEMDGATFSLSVTPGSHPPLLGVVDPGDDENEVRYAIVHGRDGQAETVIFRPDGTVALTDIVWDGRVLPLTGLSGGGALVSDGLLGRAGHNGEWLEGWPVRPRLPAAAPEHGSLPLVCRLLDTDLNLDQYLFPVDDGRIFALGTRGEEIAGWPVGGPARSAASPALGRLTGGGGLDLVAVGTFDRISGLDDAGGQLATETVSSLSVWSEVAESGPTWPMWGGSPWHSGQWSTTDWISLPQAAPGSGIVSGSHLCYPSPLRDGPLHVRASSRSLGRARAEVYNLDGQLVQASGWQSVSAREPFAITLDLQGAVSGMYLCRLTVVDDSGATDHSVISLAVVR